MRINPISVDKLKYYDWFYSEDHNLWYYFKKRKNDTLNSSELDDTLDPKIKGIVKFLNSSGYDTLPSCEGHNRTKNFIDKAWKNLLNDRKKICTVGLWLCNCENSNRYFLMDPNWKIPFSYSEFSDICSGKKEVVGYIGFYCKDKLIFNLLEGLFSNDSYVSVKFHDNIIEIFNNSKDDNVRGEKWSLVEKVLRDVIKERGE
jgi:hypothetical protein